MKRLLVQMCAILVICTFPCMAQTQHDRSTNRGASTFDKYANTAMVVVTGTTPSVAGGNKFKTNNGSSTTITNFLGGTDTQEIAVLCGEGNTIIANNANIAVTGGVNFSCVVNTSIAFVYDAAQSKWIEIGGTGGGGGGGSPGAPANAPQCNSGSGTFIACNALDSAGTFTVNENHAVTGNQNVTGTMTVGGATSIGGTATVLGDTQLCGPNPSVDIRCYHARSTATTGTPFAPGITATMTASSATATLSSASSFQNGDGVTVLGAGATHSMSTPSAPTVTPSVAAAMTGTGIVANAPAGSTAYAYQIIARDINGGYTAHSASGTTVTGSASLGSQSYAISALSRAGTIVTVTTSSAHGLAAGETVYISGTSDVTFGGWFTVSFVPDATHFTYPTGLDSASGASTSATGGTAIGFNCNHITWPAVANALEYYIYGRIAGSLTLIAVSLPTTRYWDDFGSPMMDNFTGPYYIPTTPPNAATSDNLTTTIVSGAGTTTLTLANAAATSVAGATILFDNAPAILAAANATRSIGGTLYIPPGTFLTNSYLNLPGVAVSQAGTLVLNDTIQLTQGSRWYGNLTPQLYGFASFGFEGLTPITIGRANPGIYSSGFNGGTLRGIAFNTTQANNARLWVSGGLNESTFESDSFITGIGSSTADYMGVGFTSLANTDVFFNSFKNIQIGGGPSNSPAYNGTTATPGMMFLNGTGNFTIDGISMSSRSVFMIPGAAGPHSVIKFGRDQGGLMPFLSLYYPGGNVTGAIDIQAIELDTMAHPMIANLSPVGNLNTAILIRGTDNPSSGVNLLSGAVMNIEAESTGGVSGQNINLSSPDTGNFSNFPVSVTGAGEFLYPLILPAAPGVAVSSGGAVPVGTFSYTVAVVDANGVESPLGFFTNFTTTNGNQTVTVTPPTAPAGAIGWLPYRCNVNGANCTLANISTGSCNAPNFYSFSATFVDTFSFGCGNAAPLLNFAAQNSLSKNGVTASPLIVVGGGFKSTISFAGTANRATSLPDLAGTVALSNASQAWSGNQTSMPLITPSIGGETISASPRAPMNVLFPGALTATYTGQTWTLDKAITVTRLQVQLKTAPSGCSPNPIIRLSDGSSNVNLTLTAAANDSGPITQNYAAGAVLTISVQTAAAACTTSPGDANVVIQSRMQ